MIRDIHLFSKIPFYPDGVVSICGLSDFLSQITNGLEKLTFYEQEFTTGQTEFYFVVPKDLAFDENETYNDLNYLIVTTGGTGLIGSAKTFEAYFIKSVKIFDDNENERQFVATLEYDKLNTELNTPSVYNNIKFLNGDFEYATDFNGFKNADNQFEYFINEKDTDKIITSKNYAFTKYTSFSIVLNVAIAVKIYDRTLFQDVTQFVNYAVYFPLNATVSQALNNCITLLGSNWCSYRAVGESENTETELKVLNAYIVPTGIFTNTSYDNNIISYILAGWKKNNIKRFTGTGYILNQIPKTVNCSMSDFGAVSNRLNFTTANTSTNYEKTFKTSLSIGTTTHRISLKPQNQNFHINFKPSPENLKIEIETETGVYDFSEDLKIIPPATPDNVNEVQSIIAKSSQVLAGVSALGAGIATENPLSVTSGVLTLANAVADEFIPHKINGVRGASNGFNNTYLFYDGAIGYFLIAKVDRFNTTQSEIGGYRIRRKNNTLFSISDYKDTFKAKSRTTAEKSNIHYLKSSNNRFLGISSDLSDELERRLSQGLKFCYCVYPTLFKDGDNQ